MPDTTVVATKPFWESKTFWFNVLGAPLAWAIAHYGLGLSPDQQAEALGAFVAVVNVVLRSVSGAGLSIS